MDAAEPKAEVEKEKDYLLELERELGVIKQVLLKEIIAQSSSGAEVNEDLLKKISGFLKVSGSLAEVIQLRKKAPADIENAPSVRLVWEVLKEIPRIEILLSDPGIKAQILQAIRERMKGQEDAQS